MISQDVDSKHELDEEVMNPEEKIDSIEQCVVEATSEDCTISSFHLLGEHSDSFLVEAAVHDSLISKDHIPIELVDEVFLKLDWGEYLYMRQLLRHWSSKVHEQIAPMWKQGDNLTLWLSLKV